MTSTLNWKSPSGTTTGTLTATTSEVTPVVSARTPSVAAFLTYAPGSPDHYQAGPTQCLTTGVAQPLPAPVSPQGTTLDPGQPLTLGPTELYYPGDPTFLKLTDHDQNTDPDQRETVDVTVTDQGTTQLVRVRLSETDVNTGVFVGYVLTTGDADQIGPCTLAVKSYQNLVLAYTDPIDPLDHSEAQALISPYNIALDSATGQPVNGAKITLIDAATGQPAAVIGRDGYSNFPATVTSGETVSDSSGARYEASAGAFLYPEVAAGSYRLKVESPAGYAYASEATIQQLQSLPDAPFTLGPASFGKTFTVSETQTVGFDIPLDAVSTHLYVTKSVSKAVASVGDMLQFTVSVENSDKQLRAANVQLADTLPQGFRYVANSARVTKLDPASGVKTTTALEPTISADGQQLFFALGDLPPSDQAKITYVTEVSAATPLGTAINRAQALADGGAQSNVATVQVHIRNELMQSVNTIIGRVLIGCDEDDANDGHPLKGMPGVRIMMEDGTYAVTDAEGRYHFPEVINGTHVVQLDVDSLPAGYAVEACRMNTRFAGRAYSQFVELHGGALWHANFHVRLLPPPSGTVSMAFSQQREGAVIGNTVDVAVNTVPVKNLSLTVMLPAGSEYVNGSASLNGQPVADPQATGGALVFRLGDRAGGWQGKLQFNLNVGKDAKAPTTMMLLNFGTPTKARQHGKLASVTLKTAQAKSALQLTTTQGLSPAGKPNITLDTAVESTGNPAGKSAAKSEEQAKGKGEGKDEDKVKPQRLQLDSAWFAAAGPEPEFVLPKTDANPAVPAIQVAVKCAPQESVRLSINGKPVSPRNMLGVRTNARKTASVSGWLGVPVIEGNNLLAADIMQGKKVVKRIQRKVHYSGVPVRVEIVEAKSHLVADGKTPPRLAIRLFDRWGYPVRADLIGDFTINAPYKSWRVLKNLQENPLTATAASRRPRYTVGNDGIAIIELAPTTKSGQITLDIPLANHTHQELHAWMQPGKRDWILVGLAAGTAAFDRISGHMQQGDDPNQDIFQDGRVAFYAKGTIKGKYLLTLAYDTAKKDGLEPSGLASLGEQIDPDQYFMLYGDASTLGHDAQSTSKLYIKVERGQFNVLFGLYNTGLNVTELARYDRRFNGLKSQYQGKHFGYTAFAARNAQAFVKDEIQGNGTSGLYHLSQQLILINSEHVTLVTRDRYHPERIVNSQPLTRFVDYSINYTDGTIFFKQPVPSVDENFNPIYIVAAYEVTRGGGKAVTGGGRVSWRNDDNSVEVGATAVHEGSQLGDNQLGGVDLRVELSKNTELKAEVAYTKTGGAGSGSQLTGYNPAGSVATKNNSNSSGRAWRIKLKHQDKNFQGDLYASQLDPDFGLGQQSLGQVGTRKLGGEGIYRLNKQWELRGEVWTEKSLALGTKRNAADVTARWNGKDSSVNFGVRHVDDHYVDPATYGDQSTQVKTGSGSTTQLQLGASKKLFDGKLRVHGNTSQDLFGGSDAAWPSMTTLGADYTLNKKTSLFLNQRFSSGSNVAGSSMTVFGVRSKPWEQAQLQSSINRQMTEYGPRLFSTIGLTQGWQVNEHLTLNAGFERSHSLREPVKAPPAGTGEQAAPGTINPANPPVVGSATQDFTSGFLGAGWNWDDWSATSRIEMLHSDSRRRIGLMGGVFLRLSDGNGLAARLQGFNGRFSNGGRSANVNLRLSFAHRPDEGHWAVLDQLDLVYDKRQGLSGSPFLGQGDTGITGDQTTDKTPGELASEQGTPSSWGINQRSKKLINNLQVNYFGERSEWSFYLGLKYATYHFDVGNYHTVTSLIGTEYRYDFTPQWDFGVNVSRLTTWRSGVSKNGVGVSLGHTLAKNMWLSLGYNFTGFEDRDFSAARYTAQGLFLRFRIKFDQDSIKHLLGFGD